MSLRLTRRIPIDFRDIVRQTGVRAGKVCKTAFGWGVQCANVGDPDVALFDPPPMQDGETDLRIKDDHWCFYVEEDD